MRYDIRTWEEKSRTGCIGYDYCRHPGTRGPFMDRLLHSVVAVERGEMTVG